MRAIGFAAFGLLILALVGIFAISIYATLHDVAKDTPAVAARKAECKHLLAHVFQVSPEAAGGSVSDLVEGVPVEDIEQCGAARPEVTACMAKATTIDALHACVPVTIECNGDTTRLTDGARPIYELAGECKKVEIAASHVLVLGNAVDVLVVTGSDDAIEIDSPRSIKASGARNHITWKTGPDRIAPTVDDLGTHNTLVGVPAE